VPKTNISNSAGPMAVDRRKILAAVAAITAASTIPKVTADETVADSVRSSALPQGVRTPKVCAATARRLLEIYRRNELRQAAQLPPLSIPKELRRMKRPEELEAFQRFETAQGPAFWAQVLEARGRAEGNPNGGPIGWRASTIRMKSAPFSGRGRLSA
jgi:hypothetical protein